MLSARESTNRPLQALLVRSSHHVSICQAHAEAVQGDMNKYVSV